MSDPRSAVPGFRTRDFGLRAALLTLLPCLALLPHARAGDGIVLPPAVASAQDFLGHASAISGDTAVVGAPGDNDLGASSGSASVFVRDGTGWMLQQTLLPDDGQQGSVFGSSVAIDGNTIVVGATEAGFFGLGAAYVFVFDGLTWTQQDKLLPGTPSALSNFGATAAIDGDTVVVGAPHPQGIVPAEGEAYVYFRSGTTWSQQQRVLANDGAPGEWYGTSVSVSGDRMAVGASKDDPKGTDSGSAYVFKRVGTSWTQEAKVFPEDGSSLDRFGASVSIDADTLSVGAWGDDDLGSGSGSAYVFARSGETWSPQGKLHAPDASTGDFFGGSMSVSGDTLVVGANIGDGGAIDSGSAYVFERNGTAWSFVTELVVDATAAGDSYGYSVGLDADRVVVGAKLHDGGANQTGGAWVFENVTAIVNYGAGCPGSNGLVPQFGMTGDPSLGGSVVLTITDGLPSSAAYILLGVAKGELPIGLSGCTLWISGVFPTNFGPLPLSPTGALLLPAVIPPGLPPLTLTMQAFVQDAGTLGGFSSSGGLQLTIAP
jgi:hypothetical protein